MYRASKTRTDLCFLALSLLCIFGSYRAVVAAPQPIPPAAMFREDYEPEVPAQVLLNKLKKIEQKEETIEKEIAELADEQMDIRVLINEKARSQKEQEQSQEISDEVSELLPVPAPFYHNGPLYSGKRNSYMALCHFKICNMGRKRQM